MNRSLGTTLLMLPVLGLVACASTSDRAAHAAPAPVKSQATIEQDDAYVAQVERIARRRGIHVQWVNIPTKRVAATD